MPVIRPRRGADPMLLESTITCPHCATAKTETMPTDACQFFYETGGVVGNLNEARSSFCGSRNGRSDARREIVDAEDSRSSSPEVCLWGERSGDLPIARNWSHGDCGVCPPRRGDRHQLADPGGDRRHGAGAQAICAGRVQSATIEAASGLGACPCRVAP